MFNMKNHILQLRCVNFILGFRLQKYEIMWNVPNKTPIFFRIFFTMSDNPLDRDDKLLNIMSA